MFNSSIFRLLLVSTALLLVAACGWHLRGSLELPPSMSVTYIDTSAKTSTLIRSLHRVLRAANVTVVSTAIDSAATLEIQSSSGRSVLSVGPDGRAREYEIFTNATFSVSTPDNSFQLEQQKIVLTRDFLFDPLLVLAASEEQELLQQDIEKQAARMIVDRIAAAYASSNSKAGETAN